MRNAILISAVAVALGACGGPTAKTLFGPPAPPAGCEDGREQGQVGPSETVEVFDFDLKAGDRIVVELESDRPGELVAGLAGPYTTKEKATFAVETIAEFPGDEIGSDGQTKVLPPRIDLTVQRDGRYGVVVSSTADTGQVSFSACAAVTRAPSEKDSD
jgi:hypothetical protein